MLAFLRARALNRGFLGGSRLWIAVGAVVWTIKFCQWLVRPETEVIYREPLGRGHSVTIHHGDPAPTRKQRKKAATRAKADAKKERKAEKKSNRKVAKKSTREPAADLAA